MHWNSFVCFCKETINITLTVFNREHTVVNYNNKIKISLYPSIFTKLRMQKNRRTEVIRQGRDRMKPYIINYKKKLYILWKVEIEEFNDPGFLKVMLCLNQKLTPHPMYFLEVYPKLLNTRILKYEKCYLHLVL